MKTVRNAIERMKARQEALANKEDGFSLLELVVAVSIMLILAVVGFIAYQGLTDNAREAAVDSAANQVLTAAIAADNSPGTEQTVDSVVDGYSNDDGITVSYTATGGDDGELTIEAEDQNGTTASASAPGNYDHLDDSTGGGE